MQHSKQPILGLTCLNRFVTEWVRPSYGWQRQPSTTVRIYQSSAISKMGQSTKSEKSHLWKENVSNGVRAKGQIHDGQYWPKHICPIQCEWSSYISQRFAISFASLSTIGWHLLSDSCLHGLFPAPDVEVCHGGRQRRREDQHVDELHSGQVPWCTCTDNLW